MYIRREKERIHEKEDFIALFMVLGYLWIDNGYPNYW